MKKFLLMSCILATLISMGMSWELEQEYYLEKQQKENLTKECSDLVFKMMDCLPFMSQENVTKPSPNCCKGLKTVVDTNEKCVCFALEFAPSMGIKVNMSKAQVLPSLCHVQAPPISQCNASSVSPAPSPVTPTPSPSPSTPAPAPAPAPGKTNPPVNPPTPALPPATPAPETPNPPSPGPTPATSPSSPPAPPSWSPTAAAPVIEPPSMAPAESPKKSGAMDIQMSFMVSFIVMVVVSLFFV